MNVLHLLVFTVFLPIKEVGELFIQLLLWSHNDRLRLVSRPRPRILFPSRACRTGSDWTHDLLALNFKLLRWLLPLSILSFLVESLVALHFHFLRVLSKDEVALWTDLWPEVVLFHLAFCNALSRNWSFADDSLHSFLRRYLLLNLKAFLVDCGLKAAFLGDLSLNSLFLLLNILVSCSPSLLHSVVPWLQSPDHFLGNFAHLLWFECAISYLVQVLFTFPFVNFDAWIVSVIQERLNVSLFWLDLYLCAFCPIILRDELLCWAYRTFEHQAVRCACSILFIQYLAYHAGLRCLRYWLQRS